MEYKNRLVRMGDIFPNGVFFVNENNVMKSLDELIERIHKAPSVDAVEVVRCKDCRFWHKDTVSCEFVTADTNWYAEDFCSYGERRANA